MLFDRLCRAVERHPEELGELDPVLRQAHLFHFPYKPIDVLPKSYPPEVYRFHRDYFALPFHCVAVEDLQSCIVLWDDVHDQVGLKVRRFFTEIGAVSRSPEFAALPERVQREVGEAYQITMGVLDEVDPEPHENDPETGVPLPSGSSRWRYAVQGALAGVLLFIERDDKLVTDPETGRNDPRFAHVVLRNAVTAIEELMQLNTPNRFILETSPVKERKNKAGKIQRSVDRSIYTLLTPQEIRKLMHTSSSTGVTRGAHERRRHVRRYPDDPERWPHAHGKVKVIPATWVGPAEAVVRKHRYRVRLDL